MRRLRGLSPLLAVLTAAAAITTPLALAGDRPEDTMKSEPASVNPADNSRYQVTTFALG